MNGSPIRILPAILFLFVAFLVGVFLDRAGWLPGGGSREPPGIGKAFAPYWEAWDLVQEHYVDKTAVDPTRMTRFSIEGMLDSLGDIGHTAYLSPDDVSRMQNSLEGKMEGIGARITVRNRLPTILMTMPDSPARKAGLKPGDVILEVDGQAAAREPLQQIVEKVRGPAGTDVTLRVHREAAPEPLTITITRGKVEVPDVSWHMLPGEPYAHIAIESFGQQVDEQLRAKLKEATAAGAKGVILDLRGNPGGLKDQAVKVTSEFLKDGNVFIDQDEHGKRTPVSVEPGGIALDTPLVVLIDGGTASAAEITAGAVQDHERAKLVGTTTFGTGTVLQPFPLSDGGAVLLATSEWFTPKGRQIWHQGIKPDPDLEVVLPEQASGLLPEMEEGMEPAAFKKTDDTQLLKALEILKGQADGKAQPEKK
jgi:carboxyl-terminal processing protease